ncbi:hypothetical protein [Micromonospora arborensis]|uniref:hypothetical protein n=1 Tax=Micromonospora arborensis TaxID=2116518 RepID=UPI00142D289D|nr:hypothetical protein [Micromonospora arborensis]
MQAENSGNGDRDVGFTSDQGLVVGGGEGQRREACDSRTDRRILADLFGLLQRYPGRRFAAYDADPGQITAMRGRIAHWRGRPLR